ncbi:HAD-IIB family hydrolase [Propionibacterium sp.]|uniref:HAD-IIB family hydrolase n=1 Tax=Propionibacterium sp. TaxID=1977903 RepID=UPI0039E8DB3D
MMDSLLATDLDGTVIFASGVSQRDEEALRNWCRAGNTLVLDTGKSLDAVRHVWHEKGLPRPDYIIAFTGAVIADGDLDPLISQQHEPGTLATVAKLLEGERVALYASDMERDYQVFNRVGTTSTILPRFQPAEVPWLEHRPLFGIPVFVPRPDDQQRIRKALEDALGDAVSVHRNQDFLDIVPAGATKGAALRHLLDELVTDHGPVITLGDSWNDITMHEQADLSVTFTKSPPELVAQCDKAVDSAADLIDELLQEYSCSRSNR